MKPSRRRKGATLGLVAACVLVIIVLGVGVFFLAKLFGGGREVANATDAGTLNLAKNALISPSVTLPAYPNPGSEFMGCSYNLSLKKPDGTIDLFTYNRCVGQALLIAMNAKAETDDGATTAMANANTVLGDLNTLGASLAAALNNNTGLSTNFTNSANKNNVNMFGDTQVNQGAAYQTAFMKSGGATNVFFSAQVVPADTSSPLPSQSTLGATSTNTPDPTNLYKGSLTNEYYLQGYKGISVSAGGTTVGPFFGVPVFPQQKPHLVSIDDFKNSQTAPNPNVPPNSFRIDSKAQNLGGTANNGGLTQTSNNFGGAVACAIVGAVMQNNGSAAVSPDFPVAIPTGYIELVNPGGNNISAAFLPTDSSNNIFNNELFGDKNVLLASAGTGGGLPMPTAAGSYGVGGSDLCTAVSGSGGVFGSYDSLAAWAQYNAGVTPSSSINTTYNPTSNPGRGSGMYGIKYYNAALYPPGPSGFKVIADISPPGQQNPSPIYNSSGAPATKADCLSISSPLQFQDCTYQNNPKQSGLTGLCFDFINSGAFVRAYGNPMPSAGSTIPSGGVSAVDTIKGAIIANFNGEGYHKNINISVGSGTLNTTNDALNASWPSSGAPPLDCNAATLSVSQDGGPGGPGDGMKASTGLGEYMGPNGLKDVYATPQPASVQADQNVFPIQNTGQAVPSGGKASILGLLGQLDSMATTNSQIQSGQAMSSAPSTAFTGCAAVYQSILQRVQQIQPKCTDTQLRALLNSTTLAMGQTAYIYLQNADLNQTGTFSGLQILTATSGTTPSSSVLPYYTGKDPDGVPGSSNTTPVQCGESYQLYKNGAGMVDVSINGNSAEGSLAKGDDALHDQPYMAVSGEYTATDTGKWTPSSGYGNMLGRLNFSDVVSGSASFSSPN